MLEDGIQCDLREPLLEEKETLCISLSKSENIYENSPLYDCRMEELASAILQNIIWHFYESQTEQTSKTSSYCKKGEGVH